MSWRPTEKTAVKEHSVTGALLDLFLPSLCALCNEKEVEEVFCAKCSVDFETERLTGARCPICSEPFMSQEAVDHTCVVCLKSPPPFIEAISLYYYSGAVLNALHGLKYRGDISMAGPLGKIIRKGLAKRGLRPDIIIPVPLHIKRLKERGFNQSLLIAKEAAKALRIPLDYRGLKRVRDTGAQVGLGRTGRAENIKGAFKTVRPKEYDGKTVLLIDDVYTTGATARECATVLKNSGASISVITLARAARF